MILLFGSGVWGKGVVKEYEGGGVKGHGFYVSNRRGIL